MNKLEIGKLNKLLGKRKTLIRKPIIKQVGTYPVRPRSLGKSKSSEQGVAGWRNNYHRP
jgi:hypothetical protein